MIINDPYIHIYNIYDRFIHMSMYVYIYININIYIYIYDIFNIYKYIFIHTHSFVPWSSMVKFDVVWLILYTSEHHGSWLYQLLWKCPKTTRLPHRTIPAAGWYRPVQKSLQWIDIMESLQEKQVLASKYKVCRHFSLLILGPVDGWYPLDTAGSINAGKFSVGFSNKLMMISPWHWETPA